MLNFCYDVLDINYF